jgi:hypothetical protein
MEYNDINDNNNNGIDIVSDNDEEEKIVAAVTSSRVIEGAGGPMFNEIDDEAEAKRRRHQQWVFDHLPLRKNQRANLVNELVNTATPTSTVVVELMDDGDGAQRKPIKRKRN